MNGPIPILRVGKTLLVTVHVELRDTSGGSWNYRGRTISDVHGHGTLSVADVLVVSSNVGMAKMGTRMAPKDMEAWIRGFGFGKATGAGIPGESPGVVPREHPWAPQTTVSASFGYAVGVTPLQLAQAYGAGNQYFSMWVVGSSLDPFGK